MFTDTQPAGQNGSQVILGQVQHISKFFMISPRTRGLLLFQGNKHFPFAVLWFPKNEDILSKMLKLPCKYSLLKRRKAK